MDQVTITQIQQQLSVIAAAINRIDKEQQRIIENQKALHNYIDIVDGVAFGAMYYHEFGSESEFDTTEKKIKLTKGRIQSVMDKMNEFTEEAIKKQEAAEKKNGKSKPPIILSN